MWKLYQVDPTKSYPYKLHGANYIKKIAKVLLLDSVSFAFPVVDTLDDVRVVEYLTKQLHSSVLRELSGLNPIPYDAAIEYLSSKHLFNSFNFTDPVIERQVLDAILSGVDFIQDAGYISVDLSKQLPIIADMAKKHRHAHTLLGTLQSRRTELHSMLSNLSSAVIEASYRQYHTSFKTYNLQTVTEEAFTLISSLSPTGSINDIFATTIKNGTGKKFDLSHNEEWLKHTDPILLAAFKVETALKTLISISSSTYPPNGLSANWGVALYLFNLR